jgi:hypothetical protein
MLDVYVYNFLTMKRFHEVLAALHQKGRLPQKSRFCTKNQSRFLRENRHGRDGFLLLKQPFLLSHCFLLAKNERRLFGAESRRASKTVENSAFWCKARYWPELSMNAR